MEFCNNSNFAKSDITYRSLLSKLLYMWHKNASAYPEIVGEKRLYCSIFYFYLEVTLSAMTPKETDGLNSHFWDEITKKIEKPA